MSGTDEPVSAAIAVAVTKEAPGAPEAQDDINPPDFDGAVRTKNTLPSRDTLHRIADLPVLDREGKPHPFKSLYAERGRVLIVFVRHFFCGNCQEYLRVLSASITADALARAAGGAARIVVVGCGEPPLIDMYAEAAACAFPIYADPTRQLYDELDMVSTLALGEKPAYMGRTSMWASIVRSISQGLRQIPQGLVLKAGNQRQVGGEFLFESAADVEVTWCHRMKTTRDHAEVAELKKVLGLT
ncbi:hypothetical protein CMQ_810 [Grosmannia clavigera kw1407]|uniref:Uncharacterized protein n=1 Tax=Grosmannia clavigera (strain kw1407 / UAMH 11150) TaxID=655863 RepID=F0XFN2_GROCL|nr:uncharacterized protein CMQ_810 [Grosmannia clavigera kw1407]EFX03882.1 hypothetical protein CMQ_810 [Grosmannia clavigera kw1407]